MSDVIINIPLDEGISITTNADDAIIINIIDEPDIIVNLCDDNGIVQTDYASLTGKPKINNVELIGNKTLDQLSIEPKKGVDDLYLTNAEKTQGALATGVAAFPTVKDGISRVDRLLVDFTVPLDTPSLTFAMDKNGVPFSDLQLKSIICVFYHMSNAVNPVLGRLRINAVSTKTYKNTGNYADGILIRTYSESITYVNIDILGQMVVFDCSTASSSTLLDDNTLGQNIFEGRNKSVSFDIINEILILFPTAGINILAGSIIKIYRND